MSFITISNPTTGIAEVVPFDEFIPRTKKEKMKDTFTWDPKRKEAIEEAFKRKRR